MANLLDEMIGPVNNQGQDVRVTNRRLPVEAGFGSTLFEIALWITIPILVIIYKLIGDVDDPGKTVLIGCLVGILPGVIFIFLKINAKNYFQQLEQKIQAEA